MKMNKSTGRLPSGTMVIAFVLLLVVLYTVGALGQTGDQIQRQRYIRSARWAKQATKSNDNVPWMSRFG